MTERVFPPKRPQIFSSGLHSLTLLGARWGPLKISPQARFFCPPPLCLRTVQSSPPRGSAFSWFYTAQIPRRSAALTQDSPQDRKPGGTERNCTPFVRQYSILNNKWGCFPMPKGIPNKGYTAELKKQVGEAVMQDGLSDQETARIYEVQGHGRIQRWERIDLKEGPEGLALKRKGRSSRPKKLSSKVEEDLPKCSGCARKMLA